MNSINIVGWIAIVATVLLEIATMSAFLYQRTLRKLAIKLETDQGNLAFLYPKYMLLMHRLSFIKWPLYIFLLFVNWIAAVVIFVASFVLSMIMPVVDWSHLLTMRKILKKNFYDVPKEAYAAILSAIDAGLLQTGHDFSAIDEYKIIAKYLREGDPDFMFIEVGKRIMKEEPNLFVDMSQALIHIPIARVVMSQQRSRNPGGQNE